MDNELNQLNQNPAEIAAIKKLISLVNNQSQTSEENTAMLDPHIALLLALKPFLTPEQVERLPKAIALVKFLKKQAEGDV